MACQHPWIYNRIIGDKCNHTCAKCGVILKIEDKPSKQPKNKIKCKHNYQEIKDHEFGENHMVRQCLSCHRIKIKYK